MTEDELGALLHRGESDWLDYKREPYRFAGGSKADKAELIKDCLAFANSWRDREGYILIGVEEVDGQPARVVGIEAGHFDDAELQQLVSSKTNIPVGLQYTEVDFRGLTVGVIRFAFPQARPVHLTQDFGGLDRKSAYIRRGSSTDRCDPSEIARMVHAATPKRQPGFELVFAEENGKPIGPSGSVLSTLFVERPAWVDHDEPDDGPVTRVPQPLSNAEKFVAAQDIARFAKFWVQLRNRGNVTAQNVEIHIEIADVGGLELADESEPPNLKYQWSSVSLAHPNATAERRGTTWQVRLTCPMLHAGQAHQFAQLYIAVSSDLVVPMSAKIFARDLEAVVVPLELTVRPRPQPYTPETARQLGL